ncbi:hypothetical protein PRIPAC_74151 [Pristionchus pacificus]|uniref:Uncharacterized protein n=1 Tax=Pristionchus pacificus TaxID=54126 RepID=A0A2A6C7Q9_PRIPA|nr:hypothetical protein PRIPAC_74151 [Pristionchus pacificus]|eukprot:PDM74071.1 hypothetical protein PRIPAC_41427 [Pristionchus pacificus]
MVFVLIRRFSLPASSFLLLLSVTGLIVAYEYGPLLHYFRWWPTNDLRNLLLLLVSCITFYFLIAIPERMVDWIAGWTMCNPFLICCRYSHNTLFVAVSPWDDELGWILIAAFVRFSK